MAVIVPKNAENFSNYYNGLLSFTKTSYATGDKHDCKINIPPDDFSVLGEVTKDKIGFDVEPYVFRSRLRTYKDYSYTTNSLPNRILDALREMSITTKEESFYSLLAANEVCDFEKLLILEKVELSIIEKILGK
jgi:hypothetical protein